MKYRKVSHLEIAYVDIYKDTAKIDEEYIVILKLKLLSSVRYNRYMA